MRRRILLILASILIVMLIATPFVLVWAVLFTTGGAQFVVRHLPDHIGDIGLEIKGVTGTVASGLHAERVEIDQELVHLKFEDIAARVALAPLLLQTIRSPQVAVGNAEITVKRRVHPPTPSPPGFLPRWLLINADQLHVDTSTLTVYNGFELVITDANGAAVVRRHSIHLFGFTAQLEGAMVGLSGVLRATDPFGMAVQYHL